MRAPPGRILSLSTAIALCVALIVPSGFAFGSGAPATGPVSRPRGPRAVAADRVRRPATLSTPTAAAPTTLPSPARPVVETSIPGLVADRPLFIDPLAPAVPGELVVVLESSAAATSTEIALEARGARVERPVGDPSALLVSVPLSIGTPLFTQLAADTAGVARVQPNYIYHATYVPNDPLYGSQWGLASVAATAAWDVTKGSSAVVVAVVDTGVDYTHPDLAGRVDTANDRDFVGADLDAMDDNGHGTHVAGIIAATMDNSIGIAGLAPECRILPVKVLGSNGDGDTLLVSAGIKDAADKGAKIINLSLAGPADQSMADAVRYAQQKGCVVVAAAGNEGLSGASYPARYDDVVGVGATNRANARATWSAVGSNYGTGVDVAAPGDGVFSTLPGSRYGAMSGTSMASPFVAAVAALVLSADPSLDGSPTAVIARVLDSATPLAPSMGMGHGLLNARDAVGSVVHPVHVDIPGIALSSHPATGNVSGTVAVSAAADAVYGVYLGADQRLDLTLPPVDVPNDLDLRLYRPGTLTIDGSAGLVVSAQHPGGSAEAIHYLAATPGIYYIDVRAIVGGGGYTLSWSVTGSTNDEIPGITAPLSEVTGSANRSDDPYDVWRIDVPAGQQLSVAMEGPFGSDFDLWLFGPGAQSIFSDAPITKRESAERTEQLDYHATASGSYYVVVYAYSGSGDYVFDWTVGPYEPDSNIPGILPQGASVEATVGGFADTDDVYKVFLQAGQSLGVTVTTGAGPSDYPQVYVYPPTAVDVASPADIDAIVAQDASGEGTKSIEYKATSTGWYYIDLYSLGDPIGYLFQWRTSIGPDDNIPGVAAPKSPIRVAGFGVTTDTDNVYAIDAHAGQWISASLVGAPVTSTDFDLYLYGHGATDTRTATPLAKADASRYPKSIGIRAPATGTYYMRAHAFAGEGSYTLTWSVKSFATVYRPVAPSRVNRGHHFTVYGYVAPRHTSGTYLVTLRFYRKNSARVYVYHHSVKARRYSYTSSKSKYRTSTSLPHTGVWRVRAVHSDSTHATSYSAYDYITVR